MACLRAHGRGKAGPMARGRTLAEFQKEFPVRGELRGVSIRSALAGRVCLSCVRQGARCGLEEPPAAFRMPRLRSPDLSHRRDGVASVEIAADNVVLGGACDGDPFQRHVGTAIGRPTRRHLQDGLAGVAEASALDDRSRPRPSRGGGIRRSGSDRKFPSASATPFSSPGAPGRSSSRARSS